MGFPLKYIYFIIYSSTLSNDLSSIIDNNNSLWLCSVFSFPVDIVYVTLDHSSFQYFSQENTYLCKYDHSYPIAVYFILTTNAVPVLFTQPPEMDCLVNNGFYIWKIKSSQDTGLILILV